MAITLGGVGAAVGGASALAGLFGGSNTPQAPSVYQLQGSSAADQGAQSALTGLPQYNTTGNILPQYGQITQGLVNNPYAGQYQTSANQIAPQATQGGAQQFGAGSNLISAGQSYLPYAQQTLQTGFDPQQALYNQQFQQNTDQTRAAEAARGIATTPYGAGVENQSNLNFNTNWQNQQLGRQATAAGTAQTLAGTAGSALNTGTAGQVSGLNTLLQGASLPYSTYNTIGTNQLTPLNQYSQLGVTGGTQQNQLIQAYLNYLGAGNQASGVANQNYANQITAQNNQFNQSQTLGKNLGSSLSGLGTYFGSQPNPGSASNPLAGLTAADYG